VKPALALKKRITPRGIIIAILAFAFIILVGPILTINLFSPIYAAAAEQKVSNVCLVLPSNEFSPDVMPAHLMNIKCKRVFLWSADHELLRTWTSSLESQLSQMEFAPDFAARSERDWCKTLTAVEQSELSAFGMRTELIKLSYACEASGLHLNTLILGEGNIFTQYRHGWDFWGLIWNVNLQG
jgi:hypothetical protein